MKKNIVVLVVLLLFASLLVSCSGGMSEEEARPIVERLLTDSVEINEIYFGKGLPYDEEAYNAKMDEIKAQESIPGGSRVSYPFYVPIAEDAKYQSIDEIKAAARRVYSAGYCEYMYELAFTGISSDSDVAALAKYYPSEEDSDILTVKVIDPEESEIMPVTREFDLSSVVFRKIAKNYMIFTVTTLIDGKTDVTITVTAVREKLPEELSYGWYLDTPTY